MSDKSARIVVEAQIGTNWARIYGNDTNPSGEFPTYGIAQAYALKILRECCCAVRICAVRIVVYTTEIAAEFEA